MKNKLVIALCLGAAIVACNKDKDNSVVTPVSTTTTTNNQKAATNPHNVSRFTDTTTTVYSSFIAPGTANIMISSYLTSINSGENDSDVTSFSYNADSLRAYLANPAVTSVKLMFAHTMAYINAGNMGVYAGYQSGAMTIVIAAYDVNGNYIYYGGNVLDHGCPCPYTCPTGAAGNNLLQ